MKITILDIDNMQNPFWASGQAKVTYEVGKRLAQKHDVTVICAKYPGAIDYRKDNVAYKHIGLGTHNPLINNIAFIVSLPLIVKNLSTDIIIENFTAPISTCYSPVFTNTPVVGLTSFFAADEMKQKYKLPFDVIESFGLRFYKDVICLNKHHIKKIRHVNKKINTIEIPNGVDERYFSLPTKEENYMLFVGRLDINQKGLDLLLTAFSTIQNKIPDSLYLMGSGTENDEQWLRAFVKQKHLAKRVVFLGKITGDKKQQYQANAKYMVFPSRYEGQSLSILESLAVGKSFVCFDIADLAWIDNNVACKASPFSVERLANSLMEMSVNNSLRKQKNSAAKKIGKDFSWDKSAQLYENYLTQILHKQYL